MELNLKRVIIDKSRDQFVERICRSHILLNFGPLAIVETDNYHTIIDIKANVCKCGCVKIRQISNIKGLLRLVLK